MTTQETTIKHRSRSKVDNSHKYVAKQWVHCNFLCPLYCRPACEHDRQSGLIDYTDVFASAEGASFSYEMRFTPFGYGAVLASDRSVDVKKMKETDRLASRVYGRRARRRPKGLIYPFHCSLYTPVNYHRSRWFEKRYSQLTTKIPSQNSLPLWEKRFPPFKTFVYRSSKRSNKKHRRGKILFTKLGGLKPLNDCPAEIFYRRLMRVRRRKKGRSRWLVYLWEAHPEDNIHIMDTEWRSRLLFWKRWAGRGSGRLGQRMKKWGLRYWMARLERRFLRRWLPYYKIPPRAHFVCLYKVLKRGRQSFVNRALSRELLRNRRASSVAMGKYRRGMPRYVSSYRKFFLSAFSRFEKPELKTWMYSLNLMKQAPIFWEWWIKRQVLNAYPAAMRGFIEHLLRLTVFTTSMLVRQLDDLYHVNWLYLLAKSHLKLTLKMLYVAGQRPGTRQKSGWFRRAGQLVLSLQHLLASLPKTRLGFVDAINYNPKKARGLREHELGLIYAGYRFIKSYKSTAYSRLIDRTDPLVRTNPADTFEKNIDDVYALQEAANAFAMQRPRRFGDDAGRDELYSLIDKDTSYSLEEKLLESATLKAQGFIFDEYEEAEVFANRAFLQRVNKKRRFPKNRYVPKCDDYLEFPDESSPVVYTTVALFIT